MEKELIAAKILLVTLTDILSKREPDCIEEIATIHRDRFKEITKDRPDIFAAGMRLAGELQDYDENGER